MTTVAEAPFRASRYTTGAIVLHWSIAILIMLQLLSGFAMVRVMEQGTNIQFAVYQLHKSAGFAVLILTVARIMWRVFNPPPAEPASVTALESRASHFVHMAFYALMILIPLSGWLMITVSPVQLETVLFFASWLPWPHLPGLGWMAADARADLTHATEIVHLVLAYLMAFLMVLHVAGALKHHFEDGVFLKRMSLVIQGDGPRNSYGHATTWLVTVTFFAAMVGAATYARTVGEEPSVEMATISPDQSAILGSADAIPPEQGVLVDENSAAAVASAPAAQPAHSWIVDPEASSLTFSFIYSGATVEGVFARFEPTIVFDPNDLANASIDVVIDTSSASVDSSEISRGNLMGADGFNTSNFATARFTADTIRAEGDGYVADGTLSIKGEEVPQSLPFTLQIEGDRATAEGTLTIDRFNYAIGKNSDATGDWLSAEVAVNVAITANRAPSGGAQSAAAEDAPAAVAAPLWTVVTADSTVGYEFRFERGGVKGTIPSFDAEIRFDENNLEGSSIVANMDLQSLTQTEGGVSLSQLKGSDGVNASQNPIASFNAQTITSDGEGGFVAEGVLAARGVQHPVTLPFTLRVDGERTIAEGTALLSRDAFGFGADAAASGADLGPTVAITIELVALRPAEDEFAQNLSR